MKSCRVSATPSFDYSGVPNDTLRELLRHWSREHNDDHWTNAPTGDFKLSGLKLAAISAEIARRENRSLDQ